MSFFAVLLAAIAIVEGLNWIAWFASERTRSTIMPAASSCVADTFGVDLVLPSGWLGLTLGLGAFVASVKLLTPGDCFVLHFGSLTGRYVASIFTFAYSLLALFQVVVEFDWKKFWRRDRAELMGRVLLVVLFVMAVVMAIRFLLQSHI